jgi:hypothetical protein
MKVCVQCQSEFQITQKEKELREKCSPIFNGRKYSFPEPDHCPDCRYWRHLCYRNERGLYHRKCDLTGKQMISIFSADKPYKVYCQDAWWGDHWDPLDYGRDFDFSRSFFDQFHELRLDVPRISITNHNSENSEYTNQSENNKDCYMLTSSGMSEYCLYGHWIQRGSKYYSGKMIENSTGDYIQQAKNSFEVYNCQDIEDVMYSRDAWIAKDCMDMTETLDNELCYQLHGSAFNKMTAFTSQNWQSSDTYYCDLIFEVKSCFGCVGLKHKQYCVFNKQHTVDEYNSLVPKIIEHMMRDPYPLIRSSEPLSRPMTPSGTLHEPFEGGDENIEEATVACHEPERAERSNGSWGQFFPPQHGMYGYNEMTAQEYFPLTREEALTRGLKWFEREEQAAYQGAEYEVLDDINDVANDVCERVLICSVTGRPYKVIKQELKFYRQKGLPLPMKCPDQRHKERMAKRNPRHLWERECGKCGIELQSSYSSDRSERIYCEQCYQSQLC